MACSSLIQNCRLSSLPLPALDPISLRFPLWTPSLQPALGFQKDCPLWREEMGRSSGAWKSLNVQLPPWPQHFLSGIRGRIQGCSDARKGPLSLASWPQYPRSCPLFSPCSGSRQNRASASRAGAGLGSLRPLQLTAWSLSPEQRLSG